MRPQPTPFIEANALLCFTAGDDPSVAEHNVQEQFELMSTEEIIRLGDAARSLSNACSHATRYSERMRRQRENHH